MDNKKNGIPKLRFPGFTGAWEQRKLGEVAHIETGKLDANAMVENGKYDFYTSGIKKYRIDIPAFKGPAITIAGNGATVGYMHLADGEFNAYQRTYVLTKFLANRHFIFSEIGNKLPRKIQQESRAGNIPYIVMDMLTDLQLFLPSIAEQEKVGELLNKLNSLITLHQRKLEHLQEQKKGLLQKMFPKNGETVPEVRFPGFTDAWEQRKLGEVVNIFSGWSPSNFKEGDSGSDIFIKVDDLNHSTREQLNSQMNVLESQKYKKIPKGSTIFPKRGAAIMTNKVRILGKSAYMDTNMMALEASDISSEFLYTFITKTGLFKIADTSTIPQINNKHINPYPIKLPTMPEQKQIGKFFKQLDTLIALHQRKLEHLELMKKGLLQQMFV